MSLSVMWHRQIGRRGVECLLLIFLYSYKSTACTCMFLQYEYRALVILPNMEIYKRLLAYGFNSYAWVVLFVYRRQQPSTNTYVPHNKDWLKEKICAMLKKQANKRWTNYLNHNTPSRTHNPPNSLFVLYSAFLFLRIFYAWYIKRHWFSKIINIDEKTNNYCWVIVIDTVR